MISNAKMVLTNALYLNQTTELLICVRAILSVLHNNSYQAGIIIICILQMRKLRHRITKLVMAEPEPEPGPSVTSAMENFKAAGAFSNFKPALRTGLKIESLLTLQVSRHCSQQVPPILWTSLKKSFLLPFHLKKVSSVFNSCSH